MNAVRLARSGKIEARNSTDEAFKAEILASIKGHHRASYRIVTDRMRRAGLKASVACVIWYRAMGLSLHVQARRLKVMARYPRYVASGPEDMWSMNFVSGSVCDARRVRIFAAQVQPSHDSLVYRAFR